MTLRDFLDSIFQRFGAEKFDTEGQLCYADVHKKVMRVVDQLKEIGVAPGDKVALWSNNSMEYLTMLMALFWMKAVPVMIHFYYQEQAVRKYILQFQPQYFITDRFEEWESRTGNEIQDCKGFRLFQCFQDKRVMLPSDVAVVSLTSGSTGKPKGVMLTASNILSNATAIMEQIKLEKTDRVLLLRALSHASVYTGEFLAALTKGACFHVLDQYNHRLIIQSISDQRITFFGASPSMLKSIGMTSNLVKVDTAVKKIMISGSPVSSKAMHGIMEMFPGVSFFHGYGLTEASPRVSVLLPEEWDRKGNSVGKPLQNVLVKILKPDLAEAAPGEIGEIVVSGPNVMAGYLDQPPLAGQTLATGDLGFLDEEGYLYISGRKDDLIVRAGVNIYPIEIEEVLQRHPKIQDVFVYGIPDELHGKKIIAELEVREETTKEELYEYCVDILGRTRLPQEFHFVDRIQVNGIGKRTPGIRVS